MSKHSKEQKEQLLKIVDDIVNQDQELRKELGIEKKFRFIHDKLSALKSQVDEALQSIRIEAEETRDEIAEDEQVIFVYLFNAHGIDVQSWVKMLHPSVYYEYSVNRPLYGEKEHVEAVIRSKSDRTQHGFISIAVKKDMVQRKEADDAAKDNLGHPLVKVKEGALQPNRLVNFTHDGKEYFLNENGGLEKLG